MTGGRSAENRSGGNRCAGNKTKRIICVGNRYFPGDDAGPKVYDFLLGTHFSPDVQLIDGGLMGLDLLRFVDGTERVVFVDSVSGFGRPGEIVILDGASLLKEAAADYGHSGGLGYLFRVLPAVCEGQIPDIVLIGVERAAEIKEDMIERIAQETLRIIERGVRRKESFDKEASPCVHLKPVNGPIRAKTF